MKSLNKTWLFLFLTFFICYGMAGVFYLLDGEYGTTSGTILAVAYMFIPMVSAFFIEGVLYKNNLRKTLHINFKLNKWFFISWLCILFISLIALAVGLAFPGVEYSPEMAGMFERFASLMSQEDINEMKKTMDTLPVHPFWISLLQGLIAGATINAVAGFGEEIGWRSFLLNQFQRLSFARASLYIGFIWGLWHAPIILMGHNYPQHPVTGVFMMIAFCLLYTPILIYFTLKARSVIAAAIMHGTINATVGIPIMLIVGGNDLTVGITGLAGFIALGIFIAVLIVFDGWISKERLMWSRIEYWWRENIRDENSGPAHEKSMPGQY